MNKVIDYESDFGPIRIEVDQTAGGGLKHVSSSDKIEKAKQRFEEAVETIKTVANALVARTADLAQSPDEFSVEIGLAFKAEAGVVIAKTSTEGHLKVSMKWKKSTETPNPNEEKPAIPDQPAIS